MIVATINVYMFSMMLLFVNDSHWFGYVALTVVFLLSIIFLGPIESKSDVKVALGETKPAEDKNGK